MFTIYVPIDIVALLVVIMLIIVAKFIISAVRGR